MKAHLPYIRTTAQQRELNSAINRQLAKHIREHEADYIALALWAARSAFGFGRKRLLRYYEVLANAARELEAYYDMDDSCMYLAKVKLKECGIDVEEMHKENQILSYGVEKNK